MKKHAAIVLCGGRSQRMGRPKALLPFGDEAMLQRIVRRLSDVASHVVVVRAAGQTLPSLPIHTIVTDDAVANQGPLQGLVSGFEALGTANESAFVSSTDVPFIEPELIRLLHDLHTNTFDVVVPYADGFPHPLAAVYGSTALPEATRMLAEGNLRMMDLLRRLRTRAVPEDELRADVSLMRSDPKLRCLWNLNTPHDYDSALAELHD